MHWMNSLYSFLNLLNGGYQSLIKDLTGDYDLIYTAVQWLLLNKIVALIFTRKMRGLQNLKKYYLWMSLALGFLLLFGSKNSSIMLLVIDLLVILVYTVNTQNMISKTHKLLLISNMSRYHGIAKIILAVFGVLASIAIRFGLSQQLIYMLVVLHFVKTFFTYKHWKIKWVPESLIKRKRKKMDKQLVIFMSSKIVYATGGVFGIYYLKLSEGNGYSLSLLALLASASGLIGGLLLIVLSKREKNIEFYTRGSFASSLVLGFVPIMTVINLPLYPFIKLIAGAVDSYFYSTYQTIFLGAKDKDNLAFLQNLASALGYAANTGGIMLIRSGVLSLQIVAIYSAVAYLVGGVLMLLAREQGVEHDYTLTI